MSSGSRGKCGYSEQNTRNEFIRAWRLVEKEHATDTATHARRLPIKCKTQAPSEMGMRARRGDARSLCRCYICPVRICMHWSRTSSIVAARVRVGCGSFRRRRTRVREGIKEPQHRAGRRCGGCGRASEPFALRLKKTQSAWRQRWRTRTRH